VEEWAHDLNMSAGTWEHVKGAVNLCTSKAEYKFRENARQEMFIKHRMEHSANICQ
jgi:hypothetical protein